MHVCEGVLYEFVELGFGVVLEILSRREPELSKHPLKGREFLCKGAYVVDVLVGADIHRIDISVHWYTPGGDPTGWWSYSNPSQRPVGSSGWHAVNWLN